MAIPTTTDTDNSDNESESSGSSVLGLGGVDFSGVDFDSATDDGMTGSEKLSMEMEQKAAFGDYQPVEGAQTDDLLSGVMELGRCLDTGSYIQALQGSIAKRYFGTTPKQDEKEDSTTNAEEKPKFSSFGSFPSMIGEDVILSKVQNLVDCVELEFLAIAAFNLFLQLNYTGPSLLQQDKPIQEAHQQDEDPLRDINPHPCFLEYFQQCADTKDEAKSQKEDDNNNQTTTVNTSITTSSHTQTKYHNAVLAELSVEGEWPCQVCHAPYLLLLARSILSALSSAGTNSQQRWFGPPTSIESVRSLSKHLAGLHLWSARVAVAHGRLFQTSEPPATLWQEVHDTFQVCMERQDDNDENSKHTTAATVMLEYGLAEHHFQQPGMGKASFQKAKQLYGLQVKLTGASGKRTKFQTKNTAQLLVEATSSSANAAETDKNDDPSNNTNVREQMIEHSEEEVLLERIQFEDNTKNQIRQLTILDRAILLGLCLDVKNSNPTGDELTGEEMSAYLATVLDHHDDWMVYSTALLERAWLEFERSHGRERAILQIQALADQHTNRLTLTQSTKKSIEESAPVQDRLRHLHEIVYPPRWGMIQDLGDRYASLGIFMSAAELYTQIELWDEVVECYRRSGREEKAKELVRERLSIQETPRMWAALGDLTQDPQYWEKAIELSRGRFYSAFIALGAYAFDTEHDMAKASEYYKKALEIRPVAPAIWFRLGTISMRTAQWEDALRAFSRVVQLEPEEHEAWANVAAVHIRNKNPAEAYPALQESLKHFRNNWRVWSSKLYVCLDLKKYDEAVQACNSILDLKNQRQAAEGIPPLEEKCIRAIVGGLIRNYQNAQQDSQNNPGGLDVARRSLSRVHALLDRLQSTSDPEPWLFETVAYFHDQIGNGNASQEVIDNLMKEYRVLQTVPGWEKDDHQVKKVCQVVNQITQLQRRQGSKESLTKSKFLVRGVIQKVSKSRMDATKIPEDIGRMESLLGELEEDIQKLK
ncbi:repeat protein 27 [Seminavis robusta]|uniref:Repeat protein 27 n=1 Tax=Seminavis robusta TaxID=568900 RepID=A0A9N8ER85_9STRA|nr:repeat protein 27 [Seminavis robusta]|eukprot:Sro1389_g268550.1 repeat protein 27 (990) ;mRNA; r:12416-15470